MRWVWILLLMVMGLPGLSAQDDTTAAPADTAVTEAVEEEAPEVELLKSRMALTANQMPDGTIELEALLRAKGETGWLKIPDQEVIFIRLSPEMEETELAKAKTGVNGMAIFQVTADQVVTGPDGLVTFVARYDGNDQLTGSETEAILQRARLEVEAVEEDSVYTLNIKAVADSPDGPMPIAAAPVAVYVKRMFSELKVAEGETDEEGFVSLEFPAGLNGDQDGNLQIRAIVEETESYGNLVARMSKPWGNPVSYEVSELPRTLWSPNPPTWMVIAFFVLMIAVWAHYGVIMYKMFRIKSDAGDAA
jgi:hypothetical protein